MLAGIVTNAQLIKISQDLEAAAAEIEAATGGLGTMEEWEAIHQLRNASRYVWSAAAWLARAPDRSHDQLAFGDGL